VGVQGELEEEVGQMYLCISILSSFTITLQLLGVDFLLYRISIHGQVYSHWLNSFVHEQMYVGRPLVYSGKQNKNKKCAV
jgi:hypothetical protein